MLALRSPLCSIRRPDLETDAEHLVCEIRPQQQKFLWTVFYLAPSTKLAHMKCFKRFLLNISASHYFSQLVIHGDFNLPGIDRSTGTPTFGDCLHTEFAEMVRDNILWQLVHSPRRGSNILDLLLTNIPRKVKDVCAFEDILESDHRLIHFHLFFIIAHSLGHCIQKTLY